MVEPELVSVFVAAVVFRVLLDCIVGEMDVEVCVEFVLIGGGSHVALLEEMDFELVGEEDPHSDIELSSHEEERALEVFLDDKSTGAD